MSHNDYDPLDDMLDNLHLAAAEMMDTMNEIIGAEMDRAMVKFGARQRDIITRLFERSVKEFYDSYAPTQYVRSEGLYDLLEINFAGNGAVSYDSVDDLINAGNMHGYRSGGGADDLFNLVFMEGYHGGARKINSFAEKEWWPHPDGRPRYRTQGRTRSGRFHKYARWGSVAFRSTAPYELFSRELAIAEPGEILNVFKSISDKHNAAGMTKVLKKMPEILKKHNIG